VVRGAGRARSGDDAGDAAAGAALMLAATQELTVFAEIERLDELRRRLATIDADHDSNALFRPSAVPDTHFMRFAIIEDRELPPLLAWEVNYDGDQTEYLTMLARATPGIDRVFECCRDYPGTARGDEWLAWLVTRRTPAIAFYTAYPGIPHREIVNDIAVHDTIRELADHQRADLCDLPGHAIQRRLCEAVDAVGLETSPVPDEDMRWFVSRALAILLGIVLLPALIVIIVPWLVILRARERAEAAEPLHRPVHDRGLGQLEDKITQNQLTHVVDLKPGLFRSFTVWAVLHVIGVLASVFYVNGHLGGITSIHFARWVILWDRRDVPRSQRRDRLVFFSNYDGSWESYLGEFIDRASTGLTAIWSNTQGFPQAKFLMFEGAKDEEGFKQWTRDHQIATQMWWSGVPDSTVQNVRDDIVLRRQLAQNLDDQEMAAWLRRV
jgi:hypothetical protein